jgi:hypothetical protein
MTTEEIIRTILPPGVADKLDREIRKQDETWPQEPEIPEKFKSPLAIEEQDS